MEEIDYWLAIDDGGGGMLPVHEEIVRRLDAERERLIKETEASE